VTVNMRGRFGAPDSSNADSVLYFRTDPDERRNRHSLARSISLSRINYFRNHLDVKYYKGINKINNSLRLFPFPTRSRILHGILARHRTSFTVVAMGVVWPTVRNGKASTDSCLVQAGDLSISEVHGLGYKLLSSTRLIIAVYFFRRKLNLVLSAAACHFTREEADEFLDLIVNHLLQTGQRVDSDL
jgi:hypothetical protein